MRIPGPPSWSGSGLGVAGADLPGPTPSAARTCLAPPDHHGTLASRLSQQGRGGPLLPRLPLRSSLQSRQQPAAPPSLDAQGFLAVESCFTSSPPNRLRSSEVTVSAASAAWQAGPCSEDQEISLLCFYLLVRHRWVLTGTPLLHTSRTPAPSRTRLHAHTQMLTLP